MCDINFSDFNVAQGVEKIKSNHRPKTSPNSRQDALAFLKDGRVKREPSFSFREYALLLLSFKFVILFLPDGKNVPNKAILLQKRSSIA
jgi:hypothetical protein